MIKAKDTIGREISIGDEIIFAYSSSCNKLAEAVVVDYCNIFGEIGVEVKYKYFSSRNRKVKASNTYIIKKTEVVVDEV